MVQSKQDRALRLEIMEILRTVDERFEPIAESKLDALKIKDTVENQASDFREENHDSVIGVPREHEQDDDSIMDDVEESTRIGAEPSNDGVVASEARSEDETADPTFSCRKRPPEWRSRARRVSELSF